MMLRGVMTHPVVKFLCINVYICVIFTGEDGSDRSKGRSKECSFCGKSFRSSYYLTVHLRTHTGIVNHSTVQKHSTLNISLTFSFYYNSHLLWHHFNKFCNVVIYFHIQSSSSSSRVVCQELLLMMGDKFSDSQWS